MGVFLASHGYAGWTNDNCVKRGGEIITESINGMRFCRSNIGMNWASAHSWCQKHGGHMASMSNVCPGTSQKNGICSNQLGRDNWFRETRVNATTGSIAPGHSSYNGYRIDFGGTTIAGDWLARALCEWGTE